MIKNMKKMTKLHNLLKQVVNSKETNLNENKRHGVTIWLWLTCLLFIISMIACAPSTTSDGDSGNQPDLIDLDLQFTGFQINEKDKDERVTLPLPVGKEFNLIIQVTNQSTNDYDGIVTYYQSGDDEITINDNSLSSNNFSLAGGGSWEATFTPTAPDRAGTYYYGACLSFQDQENLAQVTCTASFQVVVRELDPGLALTRFQINGQGNSEIVSLLAGRDLNMAVEVANQGNNEYTGTVTYYQSGDNNISTNDTSIGVPTNFSLAGGGSWEATFTPTAPINVGTYYYGACLSFENEGNTNQVTCTAAIQVDIRGLLENVFNIDDSSNNNLELDGATSVTTTQVGGTTYLFTAGYYDGGVSVFSIANDGSLINITNVSDDDDLKLYGTRSVTTAEVGGTTYLFTAGYGDNGVSVFNVGPDGSLINVTNVADAGNLELYRANSVTTAEVEGTTYLFATGFFDDGVSMFSVKPTSDGNSINVINVTNVSDTSNLKLGQVSSVTTAKVGGITYLFTAGYYDDGVSVFRVESSGDSINLINVFNVADDGANGILELDGARSVTTAQIGGTTYLFVVGQDDDGVSVFRVANDGTLSNVYNVDDSDDNNLELDGAYSVATAVVGENTYLFVTGTYDDGVSVFSIANDGTLLNVVNIADDTNLELDGAISVTTAQVGGTTYLFTTGENDDGVSVFRVTGE